MTAPKIRQNWATILPTALLLGVVSLGGVLPIVALAQTNPAPQTPATTQNKLLGI